eukprot:2862762-Prymnesium_polylepis.2
MERARLARFHFAGRRAGRRDGLCLREPHAISRCAFGGARCALFWRSRFCLHQGRAWRGQLGVS